MVTCQWGDNGRGGEPWFFSYITHAYGEHTALRSRKAIWDLVLPLKEREWWNKGRWPAHVCSGQVRSGSHNLHCKLWSWFTAGISVSGTTQRRTFQSPRTYPRRLNAHADDNNGSSLNGQQLRAGASRATLETHRVLTPFYRRGKWGAARWRGRGGVACARTSVHSSHRTKSGLTWGAIVAHGILGKSEALLWVVRLILVLITWCAEPKIPSHCLRSSKLYSQNNLAFLILSPSFSLKTCSLRMLRLANVEVWGWLMKRQMPHKIRLCRQKCQTAWTWAHHPSCDLWETLGALLQFTGPQFPHP